MSVYILATLDTKGVEAAFVRDRLAESGVKSLLVDTGQPFDDPAARSALFHAIRRHHGAVEFIELDQHVNDAAFAEAAARKLIAMIRV